MPKTFDLEYATLIAHEGGLMHFHYHEGLLVDLIVAQSIIRGARDVMDEITPRPTLVDIGGVKGLTREARQYLSNSQETMEITSRVAMIAGNPVSRIIGNFFLGLNRPPVPVKLFGDVASAKGWLEG
jgi:hypothetical protein